MKDKKKSLVNGSLRASGKFDVTVLKAKQVIQETQQCVGGSCFA